MKTNLLTQDKVIITAAITGGIHGKWATEALPITPEEQAQAAFDCYEAGASICHLHVRGKDGQNTPDIEVYNKTVSLIREKCPIIVQIGNGIGAWIEYGVKTSSSGKKYGQAIVMPSLKQRLNLLTISPKPEMFTINAGTFEFRTPYGGHTFDNPIKFNKRFAEKCRKLGCGIEIEVYDIGHIANILDLVEMGALEPPMHFSIVLGINGGAPATPENLLHMVHQLPEGSSWQVVTVGKYNLRTTLIAMCMGGNIRTGLEDSIYYEKGKLAESNAQLVERMVRLAKEIGREPADVEETKELLHISH
ncbi:MAG: 3-keto-5-aminohexanoate cleavage protein [Candidatus Lokiarchaeota archaeon]|nr:3-keto-5-aminohexanoate cleavage protein [Candidatus Lokiarchaeota archaeon]MBD3199701.1 3-keto-5-aminohexanoate cleavage protein [Candidatus Lokiarchaeota archaeon]